MKTTHPSEPLTDINDWYNYIFVTQLGYRIQNTIKNNTNPQQNDQPNQKFIRNQPENEGTGNKKDGQESNQRPIIRGQDKALRRTKSRD